MRRGNLKGLFPRAMTPGVDGFWKIQLTWDEFSRMRKRFDWPATLSAIHSACYRLASAASGKVPVLTEIGRSHFYDLALAVLELFSCWLASLACCLFVVDHQQPSVAKGERGFATGILGCGRLLGRSCYGAQTTSGVAQGIKQRCNVARWPNGCLFFMRWACTKCRVLAETDLGDRSLFWFGWSSV